MYHRRAHPRGRFLEKIFELEKVHPLCYTVGGRQIWDQERLLCKKLLKSLPTYSVSPGKTKFTTTYPRAKTCAS